MSYGHRATLRKECSRFLRFAYLVDFLSLEALANIYTGSVRDMIQRLEDLDINCDMAEVMKANYGEQNQGAGPGRGKEPLFYVESKLNDNIPIPDSEIHQIQIDDFVLPPRGTSKTEDFDPLVHLELEVPVEEDEDEEGEGNKEDDSKIVPLFQKKVPNIEKYWLKLEPNDGQFIEIIIRQFGKGLENIKYFERWSKHSDLVPYANALEDWDEKVGDNWEEPDSLYLDPKTWIQEDQLYLEQKDMVTKIITSAYTKSREFLTKFAPLLEIYWRTKQVDLKILINEELKNPIDGIKNTLRLFKYHQDLFQSRLPSNADIGLIQLDLDKFRSKIQPTPKEYI
jgi:dynein heavy chain